MQAKQPNQTNVVSLTERRTKTKAPEGQDELQQEEELSFAEIMRKNAETKERMRRERLKANKSVIRSYRLKK